LRRAKRKAAAEGRTLTALIEDGLRAVVDEQAKSPKRRRVVLPVSKATGGLTPGVGRGSDQGEMIQSSLTWMGHLGFIVFVAIMCWGLYRFRALHRKCYEEIARATSDQMELIGRASSGYPIYPEGSEAQRIQEAYLRATYRHALLLFVMALAWMFFGGWLLVTLANFLLAIW
jgi:hypothetical protein